MKLGAFTNGEMHFNENLFQTFGRVSWTSPPLNRPWLYLAHVASINVALKNRMVNY